MVFANDRSSAAPSRGVGFEGVDYPVPAPLLSLLNERLGASVGLPRAEPSRFEVSPPTPLPETLDNRSQEPLDRLAHARGQGLTDLVRLRTGTVPALPDAVLRPSSEAELEVILRACAAAGVRVIPGAEGRR
jgi:alkyldihydroxyacetonephosphate synthase